MGSYESILKQKKFIKSKSRILYKNRATAIIVDAINNHGNLQALLENHNFPSRLFAGHSERFKLNFVARRIISKTLSIRDRWVQCGYFALHQLNMLCSTIYAQVFLASDDDKVIATLGSSHHMKGWTPYFPEFTFNSVTSYPFGKETRPKKSSNPSEGVDTSFVGKTINPCKELCIPATNNEIIIIQDLIDKCRNLSRKNV